MTAALRAPRRRSPRRRRRDHDHPQGQGPRVRHRHRPRPRPHPPLRPQAPLRLEDPWVGVIPAQAGIPFPLVIPAQAGIPFRPSPRPHRRHRRRRRREIYQYVRELDKDADDIEAGRLFYVAATRAKQRLHLLACAKCDDELAPKEPGKRSLLSKIWWQAREHFGPAARRSRDGRRTPSPPRFPPPPPRRLQSPRRTFTHEHGYPLTKDAKRRRSSSPGWARPRATSAPLYTAGFSVSPMTVCVAGIPTRRRLQPRFALELRRRGLRVSDIKASVDLVALALKNSISHERGRWILGPQPVLGPSTGYVCEAQVVRAILLQIVFFKMTRVFGSWTTRPADTKVLVSRNF